MTLNVQDHSPHIAIITMDNQAKRNALSRSDLRDLRDLWLRLQDGPYRCIILTGAGEQSFSAGADLSGDLSAGPELSKMIHQGLLKYGVYRKPIIAAVNGDCAGGGVELLLSTDIRAAAPEAGMWQTCLPLLWCYRTLNQRTHTHTYSTQGSERLFIVQLRWYY